VRKSNILLVAALLVLSACGTSAPTPADPPARTLAIVSSIGPDILLGTTGGADDDNKSERVAVPGWNLDAVTIAAARKTLSPRYRIVASDVKPALTSTAAMLDAAKAGTLTTAPADLILVLSPSSSEDNRAGHPTIDYGVGVSRWLGPLLARPPYVHAFLAVTLIDGHGFTVVSQSLLAMKARQPSVLGENTTLPFVPIETLYWPGTWADMNERQHEQVHQLTLALLNQSVPYTLQKLVEEPVR